MRKIIFISSACGVGKSTIIEELQKRKVPGFVSLEVDELGINYWDYDHLEGHIFYKVCLEEALKRAQDKNIIYGSCMNPVDFEKVILSEEKIKPYFIALTCVDEDERKRLLARPKSRMCDDENFIKGQNQYNNWFKNNLDKFDYHIDTSKLTIEESVNKIISFINKDGVI